MTNDQQALHLMFTEAVIRFEESVREATAALQSTYNYHAKGAGSAYATALAIYNEKQERVETWRAALLDAYASLLVKGES